MYDGSEMPTLLRAGRARGAMMGECRRLGVCGIRLSCRSSVGWWKRVALR
jgi:hypothetical protein